MEDKTFLHEKERLKYIIDYIDRSLFSQKPDEENFRNYIIEERRRIWNDYSQDPDSADLMQANQTLEMDTERYFRMKDKLYFLQQTRNSPYFARIDFREEGYEDAEPFYIGALSLIDNRTYEILICDWRADIASLYYEGTLGPTAYRCQEGTISGEITLRRQIKIDGGELLYVFDNGINITDPILMEELGKSSDAKLKTVINTIQKEQNRVIRDLTADLLLVQGSAGSGKTSVALHRIAYLLYHLRNSLNPQDVIIFSPSEVFSAYIAEVLPDLGEENAIRTDFYHFLSDASTELRIADRSEQIEALLRSNDPFLREMISEKGSKTFAEALQNYNNNRYTTIVINDDITCFGQVLASAEELRTWFFEDYVDYLPEQRTGKIITRVTDTAEDLKENICRVFLDEASRHGILSFTDEEKAEQCAEMWTSCMAEIEAKVRSILMLDPHRLYLDFLKLNYPEYHAYSADLFSAGIVPYEDLFCVSWLKFLAGTLTPLRTVRHVIVDEAQEYPQMIYMLLSGLFPTARFTVLGDVAQQVDKKIPSVSAVAECFPGKKSVTSLVLDKSYRSTREINDFAARFRSKTGTEEVRLMDRHGTEPTVSPLTDAVLQIKEILEGYRSRGRNTNMILCRTQEECDRLYRQLMHEIPVIRMRSFDTFTKETTVILPIYLSKGLEADGVIVVGKTSEWVSEEDKNLMYVAATRAQHELTILYDGEKGPLLS